MPWFYVDDAFADSKPVMRLDPTIRNEAVGLWLRCGAWSAKEETDGRVPVNVVRALGGRPRIIQALIDDAQLWSPGGDFDENLAGFPLESWRKTGEILFKKWSKWQKTRAELQEKRREASERQKRSRENRNTKGRNAVTSGNDQVSRTLSRVTNSVTENGVSRVTNGERHASVTRDPHARARRPDPTRPLVVTSEGGGYVSSDPDNDPPPRHCPEHMPFGTPDNCGRCKTYRLAYERWFQRQDLATKEATQEAARAAAAELHAHLEQAAADRADAIAACTLCDDLGYRGAIVCDHIDRTQTAKRGRSLVRAVLAGETEPPAAAEENPEP